MFAPRLYVNDMVITEFEVIAAGDVPAASCARRVNPEEEALKALIEDRLRMTEAERRQGHRS